MIDPRSEQDLIWYFSEGSQMLSRSTLGGMLARAEQFGFDSTGARIPSCERHAWNVVPITHHAEEPSYTPDDYALVRLGRVSRRLRELRRDDAIVLQAYYGDIGARWARTKAGRIFALYALTETGQAYCIEQARKDPEHVRADERIASLANQQRRTPNGRRKRMFVEMHQQATKLLSHAADAWKRAGHDG
jgi:hypothetical protein